MKTRTSTLAVLVGALAGVPASLWGLEPPTSEQIESYKEDGTYAQRVQDALALGNHEVNPYLAQRAAERLKSLYLKSQGTPQEPTELRSLPPEWGAMPSQGTVKILALLIEFSDLPATEPAAAMNSKVFLDGTGPAPYDSLRNFYRRSSYGQLEIAGNTLGWYKTAYPRGNVPPTPQGREALIKEALGAYEAAGHDFSQYDNDNNGVIDYFMVFWTGSRGAWASFWWGYLTGFSDESYTLDGKRLGRYSWQAASNTYPAPDPSTRTAIHETGHALGLADYYDYDDTVGPRGGVGGLDIMHRDGDHNSFSKMLLGWLEPSVYSAGSSKVTLVASHVSPSAAVFRKGIGAGVDPFSEYFLIENRQQAGNDSLIPGSGALIWHINAELETDSSGYRSFKYDNSYTDLKLLRLMEWDGQEHIEQGYSAEANDFFRIEGSFFTPDSTPSNRLYGGDPAGMEVRHLSGSGQVMTGVIADSSCLYTIDPTRVVFPDPAAAEAQVIVTPVSGGNCSWTAMSHLPWLSLVGSESGTGRGVVRYQVQQNRMQGRAGLVYVAGNVLEVTQASGCEYSLDRYEAQSGPGGASGSVVVTASDSGCHGWSVSVNAKWMIVTSVEYDPNGRGGKFFYSVAANKGPERTGTMTIAAPTFAGRTFTVHQTSYCGEKTSVSPRAVDVPGTTASTGTFNVSVEDGYECPWTATSDVGWITVTSGASGAGNGTVSYVVAANSAGGSPRAGLIKVGNTGVRVSQRAGCAYTIAPASRGHSAAAETGTIGLNTTAECRWTAAPVGGSDYFVSIASGGSGKGPGTVRYSLAANEGGERTGYVLVGTQTFRLTQASGCTYDLNPSNASFSAARGFGQINVGTDPRCFWTAKADSDWITLTGEYSGMGTGSVYYSVAANYGGARTGTISVGGRTFKVTQAAFTCTYSFSPGRRDHSAVAGAGTVDIVTQSGCYWIATSGASWLFIEGLFAGTGPTQISYSVEQNTGTRQRTTGISVAPGPYQPSAASFSVSQASSCAQSLNPTERTHSTAAGSGSFSVSTAAGCTWSAQSDSSWITVTNRSGTGPGTVSYSITAGGPRSGTITVNGQQFLVLQGVM